MAVKVCPNGHYYDTADGKCPYCETSTSGESFVWTEPDMTGPDPWDGKTEQDSGRDDFRRTEPLTNEHRGNGGAVPDSSRTRAIPDHDDDRTRPAWQQDEYRQQPVVGWLVCIEGPDKGKDFCLHGAKSTIGRRADSSVQLSDQKISRDGFPALIVYDDRKTHRFYLAGGDAASRNNVELSGNMLLGQSVINPYDEIRIEDSVMIFVPFCGEDFYWKEG